MNLAEILWVFVIMASGAFFQGAVGTGLGLFAAPLILLVNPGLLPAPLLLAGVALTGSMYWRERADANIVELRNAITGYFVGAIFAAALLIYLPQSEIALLSGGLVVLAVFFSLGTLKITPGRLSTLLAGTLSGFMSTTSAIGGPPMALLYQNQPPAKVRATLSAFFTLGSIFSLLSLAVVGKLTFQTFLLFLILLPGVMVGYYLSGRLLPRLNQSRLRSLLLLTAFASAVLVIGREIF